MTVEVHVISYLGYVLRPGGGGLGAMQDAGVWKPSEERAAIANPMAFLESQAGAAAEQKSRWGLAREGKMGHRAVTWFKSQEPPIKAGT